MVWNYIFTSSKINYWWWWWCVCGVHVWRVAGGHSLRYYTINTVKKEYKGIPCVCVWPVVNKAQM